MALANTAATTRCSQIILSPGRRNPREYKMATRTRAPRARRMRTICTGENPRSAMAIHKKLEPHSRASSASLARLPRPMATGLPDGGVVEQAGHVGPHDESGQLVGVAVLVNAGVQDVEDRDAGGEV